MSDAVCFVTSATETQKEEARISSSSKWDCEKYRKRQFTLLKEAELLVFLGPTLSRLFFGSSLSHSSQPSLFPCPAFSAALRFEFLIHRWILDYPQSSFDCVRSLCNQSVAPLRLLSFARWKYYVGYIYMLRFPVKRYESWNLRFQAGRCLSGGVLLSPALCL